ncbi:MAG TPA: hypothetical protein VNZ86_17945, partial [Bacteroidia bacterium]|nr:hypothetical protein [Bacteroidia bacterium]
MSLWSSPLHAQKPKEDSIKVKIVNLGKNVNTAFLEAAPVISADGLMMLFTSHRPVTEKEIAKKKPAMDNVYVTYYDPKKKIWSIAERLSETINAPNRNNSAIGLSNDGQRMLLYRDVQKGNGDIYESVLKGKEWGEPQR